MLSHFDVDWTPRQHEIFSELTERLFAGLEGELRSAVGESRSEYELLFGD